MLEHVFFVINCVLEPHAKSVYLEAEKVFMDTWTLYNVVLKMMMRKKVKTGINMSELRIQLLFL
jgi:hypothetical protein